MNNNSQPKQYNIDCEAVAALIPAYSIGATDPDETVFVETHLQDCPDALAALAQYQMLADDLLHSSLPITVPSALKSKIITTVGQSPTTPLIRLSNWRRWATLAAAVLLLVLSNVYWYGRNRDLEQQQDNLVARLDRREELLASVGITGSQRVAFLKAQENQPANALAVVAWRDAQTVTLYASGFTALPPDMAYQVWLIRDGERVSGGLFQVDSAGYGVLSLSAPVPVDIYDAIGITPEPATGSSGPTAPPIVFGEL